jgi:hypothetical protein
MVRLSLLINFFLFSTENLDGLPAKDKTNQQTTNKKQENLTAWSHIIHHKPICIPSYFEI